MISLNRSVGESLIIEDEKRGLRYRVEVVQVSEDSSTQLGIEVMGPEIVENERTLAIDNDGSPIQLRLN